MNQTFSLYGLLGTMGFVCGLIYLIIIKKVLAHKDETIRQISYDDMVYVYIWCVITAIIFAKILYLLTEIKPIIDLIVNNRMTIGVLLSLLNGGFVFYGGLIGAFIGLTLSCKYFKFDKQTMSTYLLPTLPLMHAFGRIGCHFVGCCYGTITASKIHVIYQNSSFAPNGVALVPIQMAEAIFEFAIATLMIILLIVKKRNLTNLYLISYASFRFIAEFFRGDSVRGIIGPFSTSQWISIIILFYITTSSLVKVHSKSSD